MKKSCEHNKTNLEESNQWSSNTLFFQVIRKTEPTGACQISIALA